MIAVDASTPNLGRVQIDDINVGLNYTPGTDLGVPLRIFIDDVRARRRKITSLYATPYKLFYYVLVLSNFNKPDRLHFFTCL